MLRTAAAYFTVEPDDTIPVQVRQVAQRTAASFPTLELRDQFQAFVSELLP